MKVYSRILPFPGFVAINLFGIIFIRREYMGAEPRDLFRHEAIHTAQMKELWFIPFYILYFFEWLFLLCKYRDHNKAYSNVSFELEAYAHDDDPDYLQNRKRFAQWRR